MGTAVVLPGRAFGHGPEQAGLWLSRMALERAGLTLVLVEWPAPGMPQEVDEAAAAVAEIAGPVLDRGPDLVLAKSLGTLAAPLAAQRGLPAVWLTPLLDEPRCRDGVLANPAPQLLVGGSADFSWDPAVAADAVARAAVTAVELPGADHGFMVPGDAIATGRTLVDLVDAVARFAGSLG